MQHLAEVTWQSGISCRLEGGVKRGLNLELLFFKKQLRFNLPQNPWSFLLLFPRECSQSDEILVIQLTNNEITSGCGCFCLTQGVSSVSARVLKEITKWVIRMFSNIKLSGWKKSKIHTNMSCVSAQSFVRDSPLATSGHGRRVWKMRKGKPGSPKGGDSPWGRSVAPPNQYLDVSDGVLNCMMSFSSLSCALHWWQIEQNRSSGASFKCFHTVVLVHYYLHMPYSQFQEGQPPISQYSPSAFRLLTEWRWLTTISFNTTTISVYVRGRVPY